MSCEIFRPACGGSPKIYTGPSRAAWSGFNVSFNGTLDNTFLYTETINRAVWPDPARVGQHYILSNGHAVQWNGNFAFNKTEAIAPVSGSVMSTMGRVFTAGLMTVDVRRSTYLTPGGNCYPTQSPCFPPDSSWLRLAALPVFVFPICSITFSVSSWTVNAQLRFRVDRSVNPNDPVNNSYQRTFTASKVFPCGTTIGVVPMGAGVHVKGPNAIPGILDVTTGDLTVTLVGE